jgi:ATP-dependent DNA helicase DinG
VEYRLPHGVVPPDIAAPAGVLDHALRKLAGALTGAEDELARTLDQGGAAAQARYGLLGLALGRIERLAGLWRAWAVPDAEGEAPSARWIRASEQRLVEDLEVSAAPVLAANVLRDSIWTRRGRW